MKLQPVHVLTILLLWLSNNTYSFYSRHGPGVDSLLKAAKNEFRISSVRGISIAQQACNLATKRNDHVGLVHGLNLLAQFYLRGRSPNKASISLQGALKVCDKYNLDSLKGDCWLMLGVLDHTFGNYRQAINKYTNSSLYYKKVHKITGIAKCYLNIGICKQQLSFYNDAISNYLLAANYFEQLIDKDDLANTYNSIALCFVSLKNYERAIDYNRKAIQIRKALKDHTLIAQSFNNIGYAFKEDRRADSASYYLKKSIAIYQQGTDSSLLVLPLQNLGSTLKMKGQYADAAHDIRRSLSIAAKYSMPEELADGNLDLAELYLATNRYKDALAAAKITEATARTLKLPELLMKAYAAEYLIEERLKDYKSALYYSAKQAEIKDSLFSVAKDRTFNELEIKYQAAQKEKDIKALNVQNALQVRVVGQQRLFIGILIPVSVLLLVLFIVAYRNYLQKTKATKKIQLLNAELNHRVKNNLQILSGLFTMQIDNLADEKTRDALRENETRLASMNLIHHKLYLDHSTTQIEMRDYLTKLLYHIKESFGGDKTRTIKLKLDLDNLNVEADKAVAIGLIVNELATNAFKYAFDDDGGEISLTLKQSGKTKILLTLSDNGKGLPAENKDKPPSFGLRLVNLLTRQLHTTMSVKSGQGTSYQMEIAL